MCWAERFKSQIVEKGETLINCLAYIDLNPVRAGLVEKPEDYRWNSLGYHVQTNNKYNFLSTDFGLKEFGEKDEPERLRRYRRFVYKAGSIKLKKGYKIESEIIEKEQSKNFELTRPDRFLYRTRHLSESWIIMYMNF